jgi:hypothetical protein
MVDTILQAMTHGTAMQWGRHISTESWPYDYPNDLAAPIGTIGPYGTICAGDAQPGGGAQQSEVPPDAAAVIYLMHGGGGEDSHVEINVNDGHGGWVLMETGGAHDDTGGIGQYASPRGPATPTNSQEWTDIWYLPGPVGVGGLDMDANQDSMLRDVHAALFNPVVSQSPFRLPGEGAIWTQHEMPVNDDGMIHPQYVEWAVRHGDSRELQRLETVAAMTDADRQADAALARNVLTNLQSGGPPVITPPVTPNVVTPQPLPYAPVAPTPAPAASSGISMDQLLTWGRDAITIAGTLGTWLTAVHSLLGQFLPGQSAAVVPAMLASATVISAGHTVHKQRKTEKVNRMLVKASVRRREPSAEVGE